MGRYDRASGTALPLHRGAAPARPAIERARATRRLAARRLRRFYRFPLRVGVGVGAGLLPWRRDRQYLSRRTCRPRGHTSAVRVIRPSELARTPGPPLSANPLI